MAAMAQRVAGNLHPDRLKWWIYIAQLYRCDQRMNFRNRSGKDTFQALTTQVGGNLQINTSSRTCSYEEMCEAVLKLIGAIYVNYSYYD